MGNADRSETAVPSDVPTSARAYGWMLGGKDNYAIDREFILKTVQGFPECVDIARQNRQFLYRLVRYLVEEAGIRQFVDMGCGLPTDDNVHQVAQRLAPDARVVYVDIDPIVLVHGRSLLAQNANTAVIAADMRDQRAVMDDPSFRDLIDWTEPVATLFLSVVHHLPDTGGFGDPRSVLMAVADRAVSGSYVGASQVVCEDGERGRAMSRQISDDGIPWQTRTPAEFDALFPGLEPVEPGLVNLLDWRPDPDQPPLRPAPEELSAYVGATRLNRRLYEYGGLLRKP
ncbi:MULTISPECIES: SAM-dependent methyltransferase [Actinomadura]|uniref:SAM-dependent methyltransferase n=1 Tax=Actinomadura yumaensis TaxID=111807 RepID=A0ABW2CAV1_9ACTN|nr:SAM-dependent methyltransferase [Actinomadura sp. J1-007]MWK33393.1 hypothetical protein [Actinomadura sp. J1-007]